MLESSAVPMLPISSLNALEYCPRKFYYQFVQGETLSNEFVLEGTLAHREVDQPGTSTTAEGELRITRLYLYSEALHLTGFADVVEERGGVLLPVEYKRAEQGHWLNTHIQLCAQALCLEERLSDPLSAARRESAVGGLHTEERQMGKPLIPYGYIFSVGVQSRFQVRFTQQLRAKTREAIAQALRVARQETPPPPLSGKLAARCPNCSLLPLCLPEEVRLLRARKSM